MSRFHQSADMTAKDLFDCSYQAVAVIQLCEAAAWAIQNSEKNDPLLVDAIGSALALARDLLGPVHDMLEIHEGLRSKQQA